MDPEANVRALAVDPSDSQHLLASVDADGIYQSHDGGSHWEKTTPLAERPIWSLAFDPHDTQRSMRAPDPGCTPPMTAGNHLGNSTQPSATDALLAYLGPPTCSSTPTTLTPCTHQSKLTACIAVARGATWESLGELGPSEFYNDVHGFALRPNGDSTELLVTSPYGLGRSNDDGKSWHWHEFQPFEGSKFEFAYSRCIRTPWENDTVIVCVGDYIPGQTGAIEISKDGGESFHRAELPETPKATMYWLATHEELPGVVAATSVSGQIYVSGDYCETWNKLDRELGEIRASLLVPS